MYLIIVVTFSQGNSPVIEFQGCVLLLLLLGVIIVVEFSRGKIPLLSGD